MEECIETSELGVSSFRKHLIETLSVELGFLGKLRHATLSLRHVSQCQQEKLRIFLFQCCVQVFFGLTRIAQAVDQIRVVRLALFHAPLLYSTQYRFAVSMSLFCVLLSPPQRSSKIVAPS